MRLVHETADEADVIADHVETADSFLSRARGLMFRRSLPDGHALAFRFGGVTADSLHMVFVPFSIDAVWTIDDEVRGVKRLSAWTGLASFRADTVYELPAGAADGVDEGDVVRLDDGL